jgi:hypothetical protein
VFERDFTMSSNNFASAASSTPLIIENVRLSQANVETLSNAIKAFESAMIDDDIIAQSVSLRAALPLLKGMFETAQGAVSTILAAARVKEIEARINALRSQFVAMGLPPIAVDASVAAMIAAEFPEEKKVSSGNSKPRDLPANAEGEVKSILTSPPPAGTPMSVVKDRGKSTAAVHAQLIARPAFGQVTVEQVSALLKWLRTEGKVTLLGETQAARWFLAC